MYAYLFVQLSQLRIDIVGESQLVGYPTQYPSVSMMNWENNQPNARFWVLKLIKDSLHPGDSLVETTLQGDESANLVAQAFLTPSGHKLLLANKRNHSLEVPLPDSASATALTVDLSTGDGPARPVKPVDGKIKLEPFAVTVVSW
jgi:hypothetical protein